MTEQTGLSILNELREFNKKMDALILVNQNLYRIMSQYSDEYAKEVSKETFIPEG